ncbi:unnamed protein product [Peronospora belbahrii]|nr:unnamed protein product [Peronospora belbahrii]
MTSRFINVTISGGQMHKMVPLFCAFSKEKSPICESLNVGNYAANSLTYNEINENWSKSISIPPHASVLLLNSKLDPLAPLKYAESLLEALDGDKKVFITFEDAVEGTLLYPWDIPEDGLCGMKLQLSYVTNNGDLQRLDKSCVPEMPALKMAFLPYFLDYLMSTANVFDGVYNTSINPFEKLTG